MVKKAIGKKFYAVVSRDRVRTAIYDSWEYAQKFILHQPVDHKSFPSEELANAWISKLSGYERVTKVTSGPIAQPMAEPIAQPNIPQASSSSSDIKKDEFPSHSAPGKTPQRIPDGELHIYTDGSHKKATGQRGAGAIVLWKDKEFHWSISNDFCARTFDASASNPTCELYAVSRVMERLQALFSGANFFPGRITVFADYNGVINYGMGKWNPKNSKVMWFKQYAVLMCSQTELMRKKVPVTFKHVKGHSGNYGNDNADSLADCNEDIDELDELIAYLK